MTDFGLIVDPDFTRDALKASFTCPSCGAGDPARLSADGCSECQSYPRCRFCRRWVGEAFQPYVRVAFGDGIALVCEVCVSKADMDEPADEELDVTDRVA